MPLKMHFPFEMVLAAVDTSTLPVDAKLKSDAEKLLAVSKKLLPVSKK